MSSVPYVHADTCPCKGCTERTVEPNCHGGMRKVSRMDTTKARSARPQLRQEAQDRKNAIKDPERTITEGAIRHIIRCRRKRNSG